MRNQVFILYFIFILSSNGFPQNDSSNPIDFEYTWGFYGHNKVSSKDGKVYVKNMHYQYVDTTIVFNLDEKKMIFEEMKKVDFFSYPDTIDCCDYDEEIEREDPDEIFGKNNWTSNIDSLETDSGFLIYYFPEYFIIECFSDFDAGPDQVRELKIFYNNEEKSFKTNGATPYYRKNGEKIYLHNSKCVEFNRICEIIEKLTINKKGFKSLPKSNAMYY